mmetsp:Transcript_6137/g.15178  ORF Transcript_6137/g.15178 Transcript_6137/m.15178 type:complete len:523 (+) Transcript_6137:60-1628(+)
MFANRYIATALGITSQPWKDTGLANDPAVAPSDNMEETTNRLTALILIRICAWVMPRGMFSDLSTTTICRSMLVNDSLWPKELTEDIVRELKGYINTILLGYNPLPYHSFRHSYHVTISTNKLMDMILHQIPNERLAYTHGFRDDPLMQFCLLFSALIHDVDHRGLPNRQLALDDEDLAMRYNDQSIAENNSLYVSFCELRKPKYARLKSMIFPDRKDYRRFRTACINLVLCTDIASPERTQLGKTKWKEAFGDPYETVERKLMKEVQKRKSIESPAQLLQNISVVKAGNDDDSVSVTSHSSEDDLNGHKKGGEPMIPKLIEKDNTEGLSGKALRFHRRLSQAGTQTPVTPMRRSRLGFRRSMDLSGEFIEAYNEEKRVSASGESLTRETKIVLPPPEKIDDLRESVIMETIIKSADVAHNLQGFRQMVKWSGCLYLELRKAFVANKGDDPMNGWYDNQTGFLDFYVLPLARKLDDTGAYGETRGNIFVAIVEQNRKRWLKEGMHVTMQTVKTGENEFPNED